MKPVIQVSIIVLFNFAILPAWSQRQEEFESVEYFCDNDIRGCRIRAGVLKNATSYAWSTGQTSREITVYENEFGNGTITCHFSCVCGDKAISTVNIAFHKPQYGIDVTNSSCNNHADGSVRITGGRGGTLIWNGRESKYHHDLRAGNYIFQVKDEYGCITNKEVEIKEPPSFPLKYSLDIKPTTCYGKRDGSAVFLPDSISDKTKNYSWDNGSRTLSTKDLGAGGHILKVREGSACNTIYFEVPQPPQLLLEYDISSVRCFGSTDGKAAAWVSGGTGPYDFSFIGKNFENKNAFEKIQQENLVPGSYPVSVTDNNHCVTEGIIVIKEPALIRIDYNKNHFGGFDIGCNNSTLDLNPTVEGGTRDYSYNWIKKRDTKDSLISTSGNPALRAGYYKVHIEDAHGCVLDSTFSILQPEAVDLQPKVINLGFLKIGVLRLYGGLSGKYKVNGKRQKRKLIISFKRNKTYYFNASADDCNSRSFEFNFSAYQTGENRKLSRRERKQGGCPSSRKTGTWTECPRPVKG